MYKTSVYFNCVIVVWLLVWDLHILTIRTLPPSGKNGSIIANKRQANYTADTPITLYLPRNHLAIARASVNTFWRAYSAWNIQNSYRRVPRMILNPTPRIPSCHHHKSLDIIKVPPLVSLLSLLCRGPDGWCGLILAAVMSLSRRLVAMVARMRGVFRMNSRVEFSAMTHFLRFLASERANFKSRL